MVALLPTQHRSTGNQLLIRSKSGYLFCLIDTELLRQEIPEKLLERNHTIISYFKKGNNALNQPSVDEQIAEILIINLTRFISFQHQLNSFRATHVHGKGRMVEVKYQSFPWTDHGRVQLRFEHHPLKFRNQTTSEQEIGKCHAITGSRTDVRQKQW